MIVKDENFLLPVTKNYMSYGIILYLFVILFFVIIIYTDFFFSEYDLQDSIWIFVIAMVANVIISLRRFIISRAEIKEEMFYLHIPVHTTWGIRRSEKSQFQVTRIESLDLAKFQRMEKRPNLKLTANVEDKYRIFELNRRYVDTVRMLEYFSENMPEKLGDDARTFLQRRIDTVPSLVQS